MSYTLEGRLLEVCNCNIACPCWLGEDPDPGFCCSAEGYRVDKGTVGAVDVAGLTVGVLSHIPGNILAGNHRIMLIIDDNASAGQQQALVDVFSGKKGGPVAELSELWGEVVAIERGSIVWGLTSTSRTTTPSRAISALSMTNASRRSTLNFQLAPCSSNE